MTSMTEAEMQALMDKVLGLVDETQQLEDSRAKAEKGDFLNKQGLLICGKCNTTREREIIIKGRPIVQEIDCECRYLSRLEESRANDKVYQMQIKQSIERIKKEGLGGKKYESYRFANDDGQNEALTKVSRAYVEQWERVQKENLGLLFHGDIGTGKTFYAVAIASELAEQNIPVLVTTIAELIAEMQAVQFDKFEHRRVLDKIKNVSLLVLDDIGTESSSEYRLEQAYKIIDTRYRSGKPLIVTTNTSLEQLQSEGRAELKRLYDRIIEMTMPIKVKGKSRRRENSNTKQRKGLEILGLIGEDTE